MRDPVDHVLRPQLPWRSESRITECGLDAAKVPTLTRGEYLDRLKEMGHQRCALFTCMTCGDTSKRWGNWEDDPRQALDREIAWECGWHRGDHGHQLLDELHAIDALIKAYPAAFAAMLDGMRRRREWLEMKDKRTRKG